MDATLERQRIRTLLHRGDVAMLVTIDSGGTHAARPMLPLWLENDPHVYFLTHQDSRKVGQIIEQPRVALTVVAAHAYFVVLGCAETLRDAALIRRLWRPSYRAWFPDGKDDRAAIVIRVVIDRVNYWEPPRGHLRRMGQAIRPIVTRRAVETPMKTIDPW
jgi:general stress protein 26